ncbi:LOW QUALITY PROTEIN: SH3 domain-containing protein C23A1.17-like [Penaeus monodon]|uniref:LOW QUALITY PROTEIN: SH3 domain-containing protein C23A1.17-like n=1 Tax=Penaeus monodon TaxID=6687 RepID=UPI0018A75BF2|nr:LOW QUALITY PROTEIN: SH3 domain-containing protein C23A1.17-like [Penaeus monodon]
MVLDMRKPNRRCGGGVGGDGAMVTARARTITALLMVAVTAASCAGASSPEFSDVTTEASVITTVKSLSDLNLSPSVSVNQPNISDSRTSGEDVIARNGIDVTVIGSDVIVIDNSEVTTANSDEARDTVMIATVDDVTNNDDVTSGSGIDFSVTDDVTTTMVGDSENLATTDDSLDSGLPATTTQTHAEIDATPPGSGSEGEAVASVTGIEETVPTFDEGENEAFRTPTDAEAAATPEVDTEVAPNDEAEVVATPPETTTNEAEVTATPAEDDVVTSPNEANVVATPTDAEVVVTPTENEIVTTMTEAEAVASPAEAEVSTSDEAEAAVTSSDAEVVDTPTAAHVITTPDEAEVAATPTEADIVSFPTEFEPSITSSDAEVAATPTEIDIVSSPAKSESAITSNGAEVVAKPTESETLATTPAEAEVMATLTESEEGVLVPTEGEAGDATPTQGNFVTEGAVALPALPEEDAGLDFGEGIVKEEAANEEADGGEEEEEEVVVVGTLVSTATLLHEDVLLQHHLSTSHRVLRTVSEEYLGLQAAEAQRGFQSRSPFSTFMSVNTRRPSELRRAEPADIDDVIQKIMNFLGGEARVTAAHNPNTRLTTFALNPIHTRINDRGPPRLPLGGPSSAILTRTPILVPVTPPVNRPPVIPERPQFVANTRPPFLAPLPPSLASRPPYSPPIQRPYATGIPLPEDLLTSVEDGEGTQAIPINPVFPDYVTEPADDEPGQGQGEEAGEEATSEGVPQDTEAPQTAPSASPVDVETSAPATSEPAIVEETIVQTVTSYTTSSLTQEEGEEATQPPAPTSTIPEDDLATTQLPLEPSSSSTPPAPATSPLTPLEPSMQESSSSSILPTPVTEQEPLPATTTPAAGHDWAPSSSSSPSSVSLPSSSSFSSPAATVTPPLQPPPTSPPSRPSPPTARPRPPSAPAPTQPRPQQPYYPQGRPGVVLDDAQYRPGQIITGTVQVPFGAGGGRPGDVFDVTVSAHQNYGGGVALPPPPRNPYLGQGQVVAADGLITTPAGGHDGFVSIDGRKTYFDLIPTATQAQGLTQQTIGTGVGFVVPEEDLPQTGNERPFQRPTAPLARPTPNRPPPPTTPTAPTRPKPAPPRKTYTRRPTQPPIRIDTCIVGDDSTCQEQLSEVCRTEDGVSSCYCRPGTDRKRPRTPCKRMVSLKMALKVDLMGQQRLVWGGRYNDPESEEYRRLEWEATHAIDSAMSKTQMSSAYLSNTVHKFYSLGGKVIVNSTINLESTPATRSRTIRQALQRQVIQVIQSHGNKIGESALWVDGPLNPVPEVADINECNDPKLHDCHSDATCVNEFGTFTCRCLPGYTDRYVDDPMEVGRHCESCSSDFCNKRGECRIEDGEKVCQCKGSYYGARCEIDGEVLGVAVGASVAAVIIIILTLIFLCMWSRRWKAQDAKTEVLARGAAAGTLYGGGFAVNVQNKGMANTGPAGQYGVTLEDRMRWAHIAETLTNQNIYAPQSSEQGGSSSNEYLTAGAVPATVNTNPFSMYNRVTRALSNSTLGRRSEGILGRLKKLVGGGGSSAAKKNAGIPPFMMAAQPGTLNFQQLLALHAQLSAQPEQLRGMAGPSSQPTNTTTPGNLYTHQRQMAAASSSGYASLGTLGSAAAGQFGQQYAPEQFGLHQLNPVNLMATMQHQQQQQQQQMHHQQQQQKHSYMNQKQPFGSQSVYGQFGPASLNTLSHGGVSRAPTLGARTPIPLHEGVGGAATIGPMGGASVATTAGMGGMESSEDELERPYQLPRPKSRGSLGESSDIYYEPDDLLRTIGPPDRPPPPVPTSYHPQTYNFSFLH